MLRITGAVGMLPAIVQLIECLMHKEGFPGVFWIHFWTQPFMISDAFSYIKDVQLIHCCSAPTVSSTFSPTLLQDQSAWQNISTCHEQTENIQVLLTPSIVALSTCAGLLQHSYLPLHLNASAVTSGQREVTVLFSQIHRGSENYSCQH